MQKSLSVLIEEAKAVVAAMSPEQKAEMLRQQAEGWARSEAQWARDFAAGKCKRD